ncbi:MAG: hypothetical protein JRI25_24285 [Deltaproteobacteria bacterium]|nr:hypothetical protein [Deltaproteobacteria bacterium]
MASSPSPDEFVSPLVLVQDQNHPNPRDVDSEYMDRLVKALNERALGEGLATSQRVARFLMEELFDGDVVLCRSRGKTLPVFRALVRHPELKVSASFIYYALAVYEQCLYLPAKVASRLCLAHHRVLLPVKDPREKTRLARMAVRKQLSKRELEKEARGTTGIRPQRGRPRSPDFVKGALAVRRGLQTAAADPIDLGEVHRYGLGRALAVVDDLRADIGKLDALAEALRRRLEQAAVGD